MSAIDEQMREPRRAMVDAIRLSMAGVAPIGGRETLSERVLEVMGEVPRHLFVTPERLRDAYLNRPVPIGFGQTISQPFIVALMTDVLDLKPTDRVLEVGTGSGYQTAVLARLAAQVFTIELSAPLAARAKRTLAALGLANVSCRVGDGYLGWPEAAPFDAILVAAAPAEMPDALIRQLKPGGRLVAPVGAQKQKLIVVEKRSDQSTILSEIIPVCFVPLTRRAPVPEAVSMDSLAGSEVSRVDQGDEVMDDLDRFEPGVHTFSGTVRAWATSTAEIVTDSGLVVFLDTRGQPPVPAGTRVTIETRKYRPCHFVTRVTMG